AGFYVGHLDGHPAGYIKNNRTGIDMKWKSKGYSLDSQEKARLQAEAAVKLAARQAERDRQQEATAQRVTLQMDNLVPVSVPTPYMLAKGIQPHAGAMTDAEGQKTYIPATDADGRQWTMQYIQEDGTKRFAKNSRKEGCFHAVGGIGAIAVAPVLVISEGYATAATLAEALGHGTIAAFDSGNLSSVAQALHGKFPDKPVVIAGDDDRHLEATQGINPGKVKALEAAKAAGGKAIFPVFAPGEAAYPASLDPITPKRYRDHQCVSKTLENHPELSASAKEVLRMSLLDADQLSALDRMKQHTDFNDLATRSELGQAGVVRQVSTSVAQVIDTAP
ncbi:toprim domain-containing protein, partial [Thiolapillus sp.]|uniref:toprim domain-containing protein n=1 Tax=Thiolapillus sp. TaxID=2017437 RepID=UPI003AF5AAF5